MSFLTVFLIAAWPVFVHGHGYLISPAARNSMWRYGFRTPVNYNDNELFCGGANVMWLTNKGRCGICGDPYHSTKQEHMDGGLYATGIISKTYKKGQIIEVEARLTTSHKGYFQFRIGEFDNRKPEADDTGRLKGYLLELVSGGTKYPITLEGAQDYKTKLKLPAGLTCKRCIFQWWYQGGNSWGCDTTGCGLGKGPQETFVNCADVRIE